MPGLDALTTTMPLPLWAAGAFAVLFIGAAVMAVRRPATGGSIAALASLAIMVIGGWTAWTLIDRAAAWEQTAERHALDARVAELTARSIAPGSPLACLDANAGDAVESACEKALFATPEAVAAATSYVSAQLLLLADGLDHAKRAERPYETALAGLRRALEADRFGFVAHILAVRDACTPDQCGGFSLLRDASRVRANLKARIYESYVGRYALIWSEPKAGPAVAAAPAPPAVPAAAAMAKSIDFPSAASIPAVSIMNPEPGVTGSTAPKANPPPKAAPPPQAARRPAARVAAPLQTAPPASAADR
jgi:hypothetical protein